MEGTGLELSVGSRLAPENTQGPDSAAVILTKHGPNLGDK